MNTLFDEINRFQDWANEHYDPPHEALGGEWECDYTHWQIIYDAFAEFQSQQSPYTWTSDQKERLLYIIARDNEMQCLASALNQEALIVLSQTALYHAPVDAKWQLAIQLHSLDDKKLALSLLDQFLQDEDEYVVRRSLMEMARLHGDDTERYAESLWNKDKYGDMEQYQKIAVLTALHEIKSNKLPDYIRLAKQSGYEYLVQHALKLEAE